MLKKVSKDEDQLSAAFGFLLKEDSEILRHFLSKLGIQLNKQELKRVDIETLVPYVFKSKTSIIDLQLEIPGKYLIFLESKIVPTKTERIIAQIKPYNDILRHKEDGYEGGTHLVYVAKDSIDKRQIDSIQRSLCRSANEFEFFSWENLLALVVSCKRKNRRLIELFSDYIGDAMHSKKVINEQKIKNISDVLVVFTNPAFWQMTLQRNIVVQSRSGPDARYIAFLRTHLPRERSGITHIAEVDYTELRPRNEMFEKVDKETRCQLEQHMKARDIDLEGLHKAYILKPGSLKKLHHKIDHYGSGPMVKFSAKMGDLLCAKTTKDIKKGKKV
ncbi:MAG: PD-(D/E)XK nuclease family protein [Candidatus Omnitrophota bacterium]